MMDQAVLKQSFTEDPALLNTGMNRPQVSNADLLETTFPGVNQTALQITSI